MIARTPNILWIVTTQWRAGALGVAGDPNARTPQLDRLAATAMNFTQAVTPHPFGPFARAALLTGVPSPANGVHDYFDPLPADTTTIAHTLRARGYKTAFFGKWHLGRREARAALVGDAHARTIVPPEAHGGFEFWEGFESGFLLNDPWLHGSRLPEPVRMRGYQSDILTERAGAWMNAARGSGRPWFCTVSLEAPHPPYDAPAAGVAARNPAGIVLAANVPRGGSVEAQARRELAGYYAHIEATDRALGRFWASPDGISCDDVTDTLIVFTSAHGDMHGAHGRFRKGWPHEESVRVPLLVRLPGRPAGGRSTALVSLVDLPRLTLAWAGLATRGAEIPAEMQAISMPSVVALPRQCDRVWRGGRTATRKLVLQADGSPWLFFDLENDPLEQRNLVDDPHWADERETWRQRVE